MTDLCLLSATQLSTLLRSRQVSCREVLDAYIERIERVNPAVNAIVTRVFESAMERAQELDLTGDPELPLFGLPIAHKDLVLTKGIRTTFGFPPRAHYIPDQNATIVTRMQNAGAITIGKTNTPEFGAGSHTFNRVFGPTRNPYDLSRTVGGSSGGAAAALAARMLPVADGSDLGGSLRNPAAFCNVIGFRPSGGRVPKEIAGNIWPDLSRMGPMARNIDDTALLYSVLAGPDRRMHGLLDTPGRAFREVREHSVKGLRVAFTPDFGHLPIAPEVRDTLIKFAALIEREGAEITEDTPDLRDARRIFHIFRAYGFRRNFAGFSEHERRELKDTIHWNIAAGEKLTLEDLDWAFAARARIVAHMSEFFENYDILIGPVTQVMPFPVEVDWVREIDGHVMQTYIEWMEACSWISATGLPTLSLPAGFHGGLPVGAQIITSFQQDAFLLSAAKEMEKVTNFATQLPSNCS